MSATTSATPDPSVQQLAAALRGLHRRSGSLPYRQMSDLVHVHHTTLSRAAQGNTVPTWPVTEAFVRACNGHPNEYRSLWRRAASSGNRPIPDVASSPPTGSAVQPSVVTSTDDFRRMLRRLRAERGQPPYRSIAARAGKPHSTVADVFNGSPKRQGHLPSWSVLEPVLKSLGADETLGEWWQAWVDLSSPTATDAAPDDVMATLVHQAGETGLIGIYPSRTDALTSFADALQDEIGRRGRIWIVASSMKGFSTQQIGHSDGIGLIRSGRGNGCDIRIMCTHPTVADTRASQEGRRYGQIFQEIELSLGQLKEAGLGRQNVRFSKAAPTVFGICTHDVMLLNPYPFGNVAFLNFSLIVRKTPRVGIFQRYQEEHFDKAWTSGDEIGHDEWKGYGELKKRSRHIKG